MEQKIKKMRWGLGLAAVLFIGMQSAQVQAASIQKCSAKSRRCLIRLDDGIVGDQVNVLNERAQVVAHGWIIKRKNDFAVISFKRVFKSVKRGYPVIVKIESRRKDVTWAGAFSD